MKNKFSLPFALIVLMQNTSYADKCAIPRWCIDANKGANYYDPESGICFYESTADWLKKNLTNGATVNSLIDPAKWIKDTIGMECNSDGDCKFYPTSYTINTTSSDSLTFRGCQRGGFGQCPKGYVSTQVSSIKSGPLKGTVELSEDSSHNIKLTRVRIDIKSSSSYFRGYD